MTHCQLGLQYIFTARCGVTLSFFAWQTLYSLSIYWWFMNHWWYLPQWNTFLILQKATNLLIVMIIMFSIFVAFSSWFSWIRILTLKHTTPFYCGYHLNYWWYFRIFLHVIPCIAFHFLMTDVVVVVIGGTVVPRSYATPSYAILDWVQKNSS